MWQVKRHKPEELEVSIIEDTVGNNGPREKKGEWSSSDGSFNAIEYSSAKQSRSGTV